MSTIPNLLIKESSPYLLQHAHNPVEWRPWNDESLLLAKETNRLLLVSIGYSACHWCHVMEHESFEDKSVAEIMNKNFVCVKVDREERPDVDHFFMEAVQLIGGRGGWPLNCFALPDGRPVWGGTYFRKDQWKNILHQLAELWEKQPEQLTEQAEQITQGIRNTQLTEIIATSEVKSNTELLKTMAENSTLRFDNKLGGSRGAPKFPMPDNLRFYLLMGERFQDKELLSHVHLSLTKMAKGGIYDQLEGGFSRYSVDDRWHIPHFEKMLYDNAQLMGLYAEAFRVFGDALFEKVVRETINFTETRLKSPQNAFYSALDADSEGVEGKYYVWTKEEFDAIAGEDAEILRSWFGIEKEAFWEHNFNVLVSPHEKESFCQKHLIGIADFDEKLERTRKELLSKRSSRIPPALDDKILLSWNALQIQALAKAYDVFGEESWLKSAKKAATFILDEMQNQDEGLLRSWKNGNAKIPAFLDDYSLFINALIALYQSVGDEKILMQARSLTETVIQNFFNSESSLFDFTSQSNNDLAVKPRETYDNVIPSSNAVMCMALVKLGIFFDERKYLDISAAMIDTQRSLMGKYPSGFTHWAQALHLLENQQLIVLRGLGAQKALNTLRRNLPHGILTAASETDSLIPAVKEKPLSTQLQYWMCDRLGCRPPVSEIDQVNLKDFSAL
ncbi:MAG: thioredoxin domain-containing protein [Bacteroidales bacterium]|nr:thioredoxin domain-containing protein [Bacteroidales bacterium]